MKFAEASLLHRSGAGTRMERAVRLKGVVLEYSGTTALRGIDWVVGGGESWAVIGPNGAGKTSLMSIIDGYQWPSKGEVEILGNRFGETDLRDLRARIGMVSAYLEGWIPGRREGPRPGHEREVRLD